MEPKFSPKIIVGLGNPGEEYENTFHSAGALFVHWLADNQIFELKNGKHFEYLRLNGLALAQPLVFMNESGGAVKEVLSFFKLKPQQMILAHDDSDIPLGEFKLSWNRGAAGNKGVLSVMKALKTEEFWRLRVGIRAKKNIKAGDFVLRQIGKKDLEKLRSAFYGMKVKVMVNENPNGLV